MSDTLALDSLEIKNFRAFKHLRIERLARVNLIVGKNNVGKTSLLEALWLWAEGGTPRAIFQILSGRNEFQKDTDASKIANPIFLSYESNIKALKSLFHGRKDVLRLSSDDDIEIAPYKNGKPALKIILSKDRGTRQGDPAPLLPTNLSLTIFLGDKREQFELQGNTLDQINGYGLVKNVFVGVSGVTNDWMSNVWDQTYLTDTENNVEASLRLIDQRVERTGLSSIDNGKRIPFSKLKGNPELVPLASLGEGMNRMFGLALALVNAKDKILLIDEIDTGLHYSVLSKMWKLVFETARRLNVQVFATTHSWDCIQAFSEALQSYEESDAQLISLRSKEGIEGEIGTVLYDKRRIDIATKENIEVR